MKYDAVVRLLAMLLALMLAVPALAVAEEEAILAEMVEEAVAAEGEFFLEPGEETEELPVEEILEEAPADGEDVPAVEEIPEAETEAAVPEEILPEGDALPQVVEEPIEAPSLMAGETNPAATETAAPAAPTPQKYTTGTLTKNAKKTLNIGDTLQLTTAATPLSYKSSKKKVASVSADGLVTALKAGKAKITVKLGKKKKITVTVTVKDPYQPTRVSIGGNSGALYIGMGTRQLTAEMSPAYAKSTLKWKSFNKKVVKVSADGVLTPVKPGTAKVTVTTANKKKATVKVTVKKNIIDNINEKPTKAKIKSIGNDWFVGPKSVERTAAGGYVVKCYLLNNLGKSKQIENLGVDLYIKNEKVAQKVWPIVKVVSKKGASKVFKLTFAASDLIKKDPIALSTLTTDDVLIALTGSPKLVYQPTYIINKRDKVFHHTDCASVAKISSKNRKTSHMSSAQLIAEGYTACTSCNPQ